MKAALALLLLAGLAQAGQDTMLGRQVPAAPDAPAVAATTHLRAQYVLHCAGCHGLDGAGSRRGQVPDMRRLGDFLRVPGGREFMLKVPGVMGSGLNDLQVAELSNWVLATLAADSVPDGHRPFDAAEVARARATPLLDVAAERRRLLERARAEGIRLD
jgi:mono/diheme cytochrome c family protein